MCSMTGVGYSKHFEYAMIWVIALFSWIRSRRRRWNMEWDGKLDTLNGFRIWNYGTNDDRNEIPLFFLGSDWITVMIAFCFRWID